MAPTRTGCRSGTTAGTVRLAALAALATGALLLVFAASCTLAAPPTSSPTAHEQNARKMANREEQRREREREALAREQRTQQQQQQQQQQTQQRTTPGHQHSKDSANTYTSLFMHDVVRGLRLDTTSAAATTMTLCWQPAPATRDVGAAVPTNILDRAADLLQRRWRAVLGPWESAVLSVAPTDRTDNAALRLAVARNRSLDTAQLAEAAAAQVAAGGGTRLSDTGLGGAEWSVRLPLDAPFCAALRIEPRESRLSDFISSVAPQHLVFDATSTLEQPDMAMLVPFALGALVILLAPLLSRSTLVYYTLSTVLGTAIILILTMLTLYRQNRRAFSVSVALASITSFVGTLYKTVVLRFLQEHQFHATVTLAAIMLVAFTVSYYLGPPQSERSLRILEGALVLTGALVMYFCCHRPPVAWISAAVVFVFPRVPWGFFFSLLGHTLLGRIVAAIFRPITNLLRSLYYRLFVRPRRLLSDDEYRAEGERETKRGIEKLRESLLANPETLVSTVYKLYDRHDPGSPRRVVHMLEFLQRKRDHIPPAQLSRWDESAYDAPSFHRRTFEGDDFDDDDLEEAPPRSEGRGGGGNQHARNFSDTEEELDDDLDEEDVDDEIDDEEDEEDGPRDLPVTSTPNRFSTSSSLRRSAPSAAHGRRGSPVRRMSGVTGSNTASPSFTRASPARPLHPVARRPASAAASSFSAAAAGRVNTLRPADVRHLSDADLLRELRRVGAAVAPVTPATRPILEKRLVAKLRP